MESDSCTKNNFKDILITTTGLSKHDLKVTGSGLPWDQRDKEKLQGCLHRYVNNSNEKLELIVDFKYLDRQRATPDMVFCFR